MPLHPNRCCHPTRMPRDALVRLAPHPALPTPHEPAPTPHPLVAGSQISMPLHTQRPTLKGTSRVEASFDAIAPQPLLPSHTHA